MSFFSLFRSNSSDYAVDITPKKGTWDLWSHHCFIWYYCFNFDIFLAFFSRFERLLVFLQWILHFGCILIDYFFVGLLFINKFRSLLIRNFSKWIQNTYKLFTFQSLSLLPWLGLPFTLISSLKASSHITGRTLIKAKLLLTFDLSNSAFMESISAEALLILDSYSFYMFAAIKAVRAIAAIIM